VSRGDLVFLHAAYEWRRPSPWLWNVTDLRWDTRIFEETTLEQSPSIFAQAQKFGGSEPRPLREGRPEILGGQQLHTQTPPSHRVISFKTLLKGKTTQKTTLQSIWGQSLWVLVWMRNLSLTMLGTWNPVVDHCWLCAAVQRWQQHEEPLHVCWKGWGYASCLWNKKI